MPETQKTTERMAHEIFELYQLIAIARSRHPAGGEDLSETEFLALDALVKEEPLTVGQIQRRIGVVPAQMSRIVRALERKEGKNCIRSQINAQDRRRINIFLTDKGRAAHEKYRNVRLRSMYEILAALNPEDRTHFMRIMGVLREAYKKRLTTTSDNQSSER